MTNPLDPSLSDLNTCECCSGTSVRTPAAIENRPGLPAIAFRAGTHSQFFASLLAALSSQQAPMLRALGTRETNDFTIALLDAFACTTDVLTFYSERIANEAFLRTATERRSVLELVRSISYELSPGVSAAVLLSFTIEGGRGAPGTAIIPAGTRVQSIPGPGENPQVFETSAEFVGRAAWNELRPRLRSAPLEGAALLTSDELYLAGTGTNLRPGDVLVVSDGEAAEGRRVKLVELDRELDHTRITFDSASSQERVLAPRRRNPQGIDIAAGHEPTAQVVAGLFVNSSVSASEMYALSHFHRWNLDDVQNYLNRRPKISLTRPDQGVFALRSQLGFFGHNAPKWASLPHAAAPGDDAAPKVADPYPNSWDSGERTIWEDSQGQPHSSFDVFLERSVPEVIREGWVVFESPDRDMLALRVGRSADVSRADYAMSAKCTALQLQNILGTPLNDKDSSFKNRTTTAHVQSEPLAVIGAPIRTNLESGLIELALDRIEKDLGVGQAVALKGENAVLPGTFKREIVVIDEIRHSDVTILTLRDGLKHSYIRSTVTLNANVVPATHGETTEEVLGSGDATRSFQTFALRQKPLTYTFPPGGARAESSLVVRVDGVQWSEVASFYGCGPNDRVYIVRHSDDGTTSVQFGDGRQGARLPTGRENIRATYRKGIGAEGLVNEEQINLLITQPLGVKGVTNLLAPQGAEEPQSMDDARFNAPQSVLTLDRVVSLQDYEDFARNFLGVDKAHAAWMWAGPTRGVLLTLLGPQGAVISESGPPADPLRVALRVQGSPRVLVRIVSRPPSLFAITGTVRIDNDRRVLDVQNAVKEALLAHFSFEARQFGQGVALSEVIAVIQRVPGVAFVDVTRFEKTSLAGGVSNTEVASKGYLSARRPENGADADQVEPAELLILDERSLSQLEVKSS